MALRTLVFSSDASATQIVAQHLLEFDLEPIICHDIFSALENLGRNRFDGILVDWSDDPEASFLITRVKETELNRRATLLAIVRSQGEAARATEMGAKAVLFRPLTRGEIREVLTITRPFMFERAVAIESIPTSATSEHASVKKTEQAAEDVMPIASPLPTPAAKPRRAEPRSFAGFAPPPQTFLSEQKRKGIPVVILAIMIAVATVPLLLRYTSSLGPAGTKAGSKVREIVNKVVLPKENIPIPPKDPSFDDASVSSPSGHVRVVTSFGVLYETAARLPLRHEALPEFPLAVLQPNLPPPPRPKRVQIPDSIRRSSPMEVAHAPEPHLARAWLETAEPVTISEDLARRLLLQGNDPAYPKEARLSGLQGSVMIQALIGRDGSVRELHLMGGYFVLGRAAFEAVRQWRFRPYVLNGTPVEARTVLTFTFELPIVSGTPATSATQ